MKTRFPTIVGVAAGLLVGATATVKAQFDYHIHDGTVIITKYTGLGGDVVIPDTIDGLAVTGVGHAAFNGRTSLTSIVIPNSIISIDWLAFCGCTSLINIAIPEGVTRIDGEAFAGCTGLIRIDVAAANHAYTSVAGVLFNKAETELVVFPPGREGTYTIPDSVTTIASSAFVDCISLTSITVPDKVTRIGWGAFSGCTSLGTVAVGPNRGLRVPRLYQLDQHRCEHDEPHL
jgi:hypothetical protein